MKSILVLLSVFQCLVADEACAAPRDDCLQLSDVDIKKLTDNFKLEKTYREIPAEWTQQGHCTDQLGDCSFINPLGPIYEILNGNIVGIRFDNSMQRWRALKLDQMSWPRGRNRNINQMNIKVTSKPGLREFERYVCPNQDYADGFHLRWAVNRKNKVVRFKIFSQI